MSARSLTQVEAARRAALIQVRSYDIAVDFTALPDGPEVRCVSTVTFDCREPGAASFIDCAAEVTGATLNGEPLPAAVDERIELPALAAENVLEIESVQADTSGGEGVHKATDPADGEVYVWMSFEPDEARHVWACFDQPDLKAPHTFTVTAPAAWTVTSNSGGPRIEDAGTARVWRFPATPALSPYNTVVNAGPFHELSRSAGGFDLRLFARKSLAAQLERDADDVFTVTAQGLAFYGDVFGMPFPQTSYDQVFMPEFGGAMENFGCVTWTDNFLRRSTPTPAERESFAAVLLHEMAHMWFGDLVTMRWWDDLWLNESFAEWACHHTTAEITEFTTAWTGFTNSRKNWAYRQDQLPSTHPIAADNVDLHAVEVNFDGITYAKGAAVLKQLVAWVGLQPFLEGLRGYFADHAFGNAEFGDLLVALEKSSGRELEGWAREWLQTAGVNTLTPHFEIGDDGTYRTFAVRQSATAEHPTLRRHRLGVGLYDRVDGRLVLRASHETDVLDELTDVAALVGQRQPDLLLLNDGDLAYAKVRFDDRSLATVVESLGTLDDSLARALCWGAAWDMTRDAEMAASDFVTLVLAGLASETDPTAITRLPAYATTAVRLYAAPEHRAALATRLETGLRDLMVGAEAGSDLQLTLVRAYAGLASGAQALDDLEQLLDATFTLDGLAVDDDLRWTLLKGLARTGRADADRIADELARDNTISGQERAAACRAIRPTAEAKAEAWRDAVERDDIANETQRSIAVSFQSFGQDDVLAPYVEKYLTVADTLWEDKGTQRASTALQGLFPVYLASPELVERVDAWLASSPANAAAKRLVAEGRDDAARALRAQVKDAGQ